MSAEDFINKYLEELSAKHGIKKPPWYWSGWADPAGRGVALEFSPLFKRFWELEPERTKTVLKNAIAHEFRHWLTFAKHIKIPLPKGPIWREPRRRWSEAQARAFAYRETGITHARAMLEWKLLKRKYAREPL